MSASMFDMRQQVTTAIEEMRAEYGTNPEDYEDYIFEAVDGLVPCYTKDTIEEWMIIDIFDSTDYCGDYDIMAQMRAALYEWYDCEFREQLAAIEEDTEED